MNKANLLSICIPTYNRAESVKKCIEDILSLKLSNIEIVVSDNASTDRTEQLLAEYVNKGVISYSKNEKNIGYRNIYEAMRKASSKYCFLLSDEDALIKDGVEKLLSILETCIGIGFIQTNYKPKYRCYYKANKSAISNLATRAFMYMSGQVFLREAIPNIAKDEYENYMFSHYPHNYLIYKILNNYDGILFKESTCIIGARESRKNDSTMYGLTDSIWKKINCEYYLINETQVSSYNKYKASNVLLKKDYQYLLKASDKNYDNLYLKKELFESIRSSIKNNLELKGLYRWLFTIQSNIWYILKK